ncbi:septum formation inhibitor Maf, partial [Pseudoxanthomonas sp. SGD-10]
PSEGVIISADTVVIVDGEILGKPVSAEDACHMLQKLSGKMHKVVTGVSLVTRDKRISFSEVTEVFFRTLTADQIQYYVQHYRPFDKAGAYGIQEWIGLVAIERINGSYTNVVGLSTEKLYNKLVELGIIT